MLQRQLSLPAPDAVGRAHRHKRTLAAAVAQRQHHHLANLTLGRCDGIERNVERG
jgi:hypothetical protein